MARGPTTSKITFTRDEREMERHFYRDMKALIQAVKVKPPPVKREDDALNPLTTWMP